MADVFISYHSTDENLAKHVHTYLLRERVKPFLARLSLQTGTEWEPSIRAELQRSPWVVLLASRAACASPYVLQEMGGALPPSAGVSLRLASWRQRGHSKASVNMDSIRRKLT